MRNWGVLGGAAAALAAGIYVLWGPITGRKRRRRGLVPGLLNLGNTCFMNSLLQGLSSCPSFIRWLEEFTAQYRTEQEKSQEHQYLSVTLLQLLRALSCQEVTEDDVLDASCLLEVLRMNRWQISSFEEQVMAGIWENSHCYPLDKDPSDLELSDVNPASRKVMENIHVLGSHVLGMGLSGCWDIPQGIAGCFQIIIWNYLQAWNARARNIKAEEIQP